MSMIISLHKNLIEHLNAEIVLGTIPQLSVALDWLKSTFLYVRIMKNAEYYGKSSGHEDCRPENLIE